MSNKEVLVYVSEGCISCQKLLEKMDNFGIDYKTKNITEDDANKKELQDCGVYGTPATFIDEDAEPILGFQPNKLKRELGINGF